MLLYVNSAINLNPSAPPYTLRHPALYDIPKGMVLSIDRMLHGTVETLADQMLSSYMSESSDNHDFIRCLNPRTELPAGNNYENMDAIVDLLWRKLNKNAFRYKTLPVRDCEESLSTETTSPTLTADDNLILLLGHAVSFYNHACDANGCIVHLKVGIKSQATVSQTVYYCAVLASKDISRGEQVFISYGDDAGHVSKDVKNAKDGEENNIHNFSACMCNRNGAERSLRNQEKGVVCSNLASKSNLVTQLISDDVESVRSNIEK